MAVYAIGDLQGCYSPLRRLLDRLQFEPGRDRLWFTGDLVNRGPESLEALRFVKALGGAAVTVLGNHDLHLLAVAQGVKPLRPRKDTLANILDAPDRDALLDWLCRQPLLHEDAGLGYVMVHAGLPPDWSVADASACARVVETTLAGADRATLLAHMYGDTPERWSPDLESYKLMRFTINCLTRLRYVHDDGRLALDFKGAPGDAPRGLVPWFRAPFRRSARARIVFGHWSTLGVVPDRRVFPLDSGCVWGGQLTALRLDGEPRRVCVACEQAREPG